MDPKTTSPAAQDALATMLQNATIDSDMLKSVIGYHNNIGASAIPTEAPENSAHELHGSVSYPATRTPLTSTEASFTPPSTTGYLILPRELVERILLLLNTESLLTCRLVNKEFNEIIQSSIPAQYFLACKVAGVIDNPRSPLSYAERLEALNKREEAWRNLKPAFETTIRVDDQIGQPSTFYELTSGNYFLTDNDREDLYYCPLPSFAQDNPKWIKVPSEGPGQSWSGLFVDMGMAIYEHDLIVNVIFSDVGNQADAQQHSLDLIFLKFSTGEYHPLAHHPRINVQKSNFARPFVHPRIVGDNLALVVMSRDGAFSDKLFIFDWKTGHKRLEHEVPEDAYTSLVFISPELLLVPNLLLSHFEVWYLPPNPDSNPPAQILSLRFPAVSDGHSIVAMHCHGDLNPFLHSMPYFPPRPFFSSPEKSIIVVNFNLQSFQIPSRSVYTLIMHRCALLDTIQKWISPLVLVQHGLPWSMNEVTLSSQKRANSTDGSGDGSVVLAQSKIVPITPDLEPSPTTDSPTLENDQNSPSPTSHVSAESGSSSPGPSNPSTSRYNIPQVQWTHWGPPISRWFQANRNQKWRSHCSIGERYVFLNSDPHDKRISVADFNPHNVRKGNGDSGGTGNNKEGTKEESDEELDILVHEDVFAEEVYMGLKCVVSDVPDEYDFDAVLMDEERLLGLKVDYEDRVESIKVLYVG